jgi:uncharacterized membrane protein YeiH
MAGLLPLIEWVGVAVFALTGALVAARKGMDPFGFVLLGTVTGIGGGTLRDVLLGARPVAWIMDPTVVLICTAVSLAAFVSAHHFEREGRARTLLWADALGLALFAITGTATALASGAPPVSAVLLGVVTATFGGIIRDILAGDVPLVLRRDVYVTAALAGSTAFTAAMAVLPLEAAAVLGFAVGFGLRALAILRGWSLPQYGQRADD